MTFQTSLALLLVLHLIGIVVNGVALARPLAQRLRKLLSQGTGAGGEEDIMQIRSRLRGVYIAQLVMFLAVFVLSIFKF
jgi:hypothetical protein